MATADIGKTAAAATPTVVTSPNPKKRTKLYFFRTSKGNTDLGIYVDGRIIYDYGDRVDPLEGLVTVSKSSSMIGSGMTGTLLFENDDLSLCKDVFFKKVIELYPNATDVTVSSGQTALMRKLNGSKHCFPLKINFPLNLPASVVLRPEAFYHGTVVGVTYSVNAYYITSTDRKRFPYVNVSLQKINFLVSMPKEVPLSVQKDKTFMFESTRPVTVKVELDKCIYELDDEIHVKVNIENRSKKDVISIRISIKQAVEWMSQNGLHRQSARVAYLETSAGCPIQKKTSYSRTFAMKPKITSHAEHHLAQEFKLNMADQPLLAASTRPDTNDKHLRIKYYANVYAVVSMGSDVKLTLPLKLSKALPKIENKSKQNQAPINTSTNLSTKDLNSFTESSSIRSSASSNPEVGLLIDFETEPTVDQLLPSVVSENIPALRESSNPEASIVLLQGVNLDLRHAEAQAAMGRLVAPNGLTSESSMSITAHDVVKAGRALGSMISALLFESSCLPAPPIADDIICNISEALTNVASAMHALAQTVIAIACRFNKNSITVNDMLHWTVQINDKTMFLCSAVQRRLHALDIDVHTLNQSAEYISRALPSLLNALPDQQACIKSLNTVRSILSHVDNFFATSTEISSMSLIEAVDAVHLTSQIFSEAFKCCGPRAASTSEGLTQAVQDYEKTLPHVIAAALGVVQLAGADGQTLLPHIHEICVGSGALLQSLKLLAFDKSPNTQTALSNGGARVVDSMKAILYISHNIKATSQAQPIPSVDEFANNNNTSEVSRRESFDAFICDRELHSASAATTSGVLAAEKLPANFEESFLSAKDTLNSMIIELSKTRNDVAESKCLPRRRSILLSMFVLPGKASVLDSLLLITDHVMTLMQHVCARVHELSILGRAFHSTYLLIEGRPELWTDIIGLPAAQLCDAVKDLNRIGVRLSNGKETPDALVKHAKAVSSATFRLTAASQVKEYINSTSQEDVETASRNVNHETYLLVTAIMEVLSASSTKTPLQRASLVGISESSLVDMNADNPELNSEMARLELEDSLAKAQEQSYKRRGSIF